MHLASIELATMESKRVYGVNTVNKRSRCLNDREEVGKEVNG